MIRFRRYPRMSNLLCAAVLLSAVARDMCVGASYDGWARVLLVVTCVLLPLSFAVMSSRFFVDELGVGVGFLLRVRRANWEDIASCGLICCNSRRQYLYGMYHRSTDFLDLLHRAPVCGSWGFVVPMSRKLRRAIVRFCPFALDLSPVPPKKREGRLRPQWHQAALYMLAMLPCAAVAFVTGALMLLRAAQLTRWTAVSGLTLGAIALFAAGLALLHRALGTALTCPAFNEQGVCAGSGLYLSWEDVRFGYVHRIASLSGMFLLSQPLEAVTRRGAPPVLCLSMPDTSTMLLAYLTYCPHAPKDLNC